MPASNDSRLIYLALAVAQLRSCAVTQHHPAMRSGSKTDLRNCATRTCNHNLLG